MVSPIVIMLVMVATIMTLPVKIILYTYMQVINNELIFFRKFSDPSRFLATLVALHFTPVSKWDSGQSFELA